MPLLPDHVLPSLTALGSVTYWVFGLLALLEAVVLTGALVPGVVAILVGGALAQRGVLDVVDLLWFAALGTVIGTEVNYRLARLAAKARDPRPLAGGSAQVLRARQMVDRHGGAAMMTARFRGSLSALVTYAAAAAGLRHARYSLWNLASALPYTLIMVGLGYGAGQALATLASAAPRSLVFALLVGVVLVLGLLGLRRIGRMAPVLKDIGLTVAAGLGQQPLVRRLLDRHPRVRQLFAARFGTDQFMGLTATVLGALLVYIAVAYVDSVYDVLGNRGATATDTRIANLFYTMRDDRLIAVLGWITEIGGRHGVLPLLAGFTAALLVLRRFDLLGGVWIAAVGNQLTVTLLKSFFARPRSDLGYFVETSGSFPSGHAAGAVAVWAMLFYLAWRLGLMRASLALGSAVVTAALIGFSRVYLVEHYVSDVLNGYLVGGFWLILGIAFCEWRRRRPRGHASRRRHWIATGCIVAAAGAAVVIASTTVSPMNDPFDRATRMIAAPADLLADAAVPTMTEVLSGAPRQRIDLIVTVPDSDRLIAAVEGAGWTQAPRPGLPLLALAVFDDWTGRPLPEPLVIPTFWDNRPTELAFARSAPDAGSQRLHLRFWDSLTRTAEGRTVMVATLTEEDPLDATTDDATPPPGPAVPAALDQLTQALTAAGLAVDRP